MEISDKRGAEYTAPSSQDERTPHQIGQPLYTSLSETRKPTPSPAAHQAIFTGSRHGYCECKAVQQDRKSSLGSLGGCDNMEKQKNLLQNTLESAVDSSTGNTLSSCTNMLSGILQLSPEIRKARSNLVQHSSYGVCGILLGGVMAGPLGAMLGGIIGSIVGWKNTDNYTSVVGAMKKMSDEEKIQIFDHIQEVLRYSTQEAVQTFVHQTVLDNTFVRAAKTVGGIVPRVASPILHPVNTVTSLASAFDPRKILSSW